MEDLPLCRIAVLVPEFAVKDLPLGRTLMMMNVKKSQFSLFLATGFIYRFILIQMLFAISFIILTSETRCVLEYTLFTFSILPIAIVKKFDFDIL